jgi:hypothetical protein
MASYNYTFTSGDTVTPTKLNSARTVSDIVNADIKSDAAIALSKLATGALPAAITVASDNLVDGTIVNADINASAAIAGTKVDPNFGSQNVATTGNGSFAQVLSAGNAPHIQLLETDASANNQKWDIVAANEALFVRAVNDAYTNAGNAIEIQRTGTTIDSVSMPNGNVGIGTSSPARRLHTTVVAAPTAAQNSKAGLLLQNGDGTGTVAAPNTAMIQFAYDPATPRAYIEGGTFGNDMLAFGFAQNERMRIDASGNVGIGTASPTVKLDVNGGIASSTAVPLHIKGSDFKYITCESDHLAFYKKAGAYDFYFRKSDDGTQNGSNAAELMIIKDSGNVGIGTASPSTKLEVNGTVTATAFSGNVTGNLTGTASAIADGSVSTAKIVDGNVTLAKLVTAVQNALVPAGAVQAFAMNSAPAGWLAADGSNVNRTTYAALFSAIGTTYGAGDGSTTFALPDLRGYFVRGSGTNSDGTASGAFGVKQADELKSHTHSGSFLLSSGPLNLGGTGASILAPLTVGSVTATGGTETRPANIAMLYCIKF